MELQLNVPGRKYKLPVTIIPMDGRLRLKYGFSKEMNAEVKAMQGAKYHGFDNPETKYWTIADTPRNWFCIKYMAGENTYQRYDLPITPVNPELYPGAYPHQIEGAADGLTRRRKIFAWEMGCTKTWMAIMIMEQSGHHDWWWVGTKGSLREMPGEFHKRLAKVKPRFMTYDELKKIVENWPKGQKAPRGIVYDEGSKAKTPTSQRGQASMHVSIAIEQDWGDEGYVIILTGTPAPKDPCDWWHLCEIAKPGFLREGSVGAFKKRLALSKQKQGEYGVYPEHITWWDDENKCATCGQFEKDNHAHDVEKAMVTCVDFHQFKKSINEVKNVYKRMAGLVSVKFKKEVLKHLPDKRYHVEILPPAASLVRTAKTILRTAKSTIVGLTLLRELSDGFQYVDVPDGTGPCESCKCTGQVVEYFDKDNPDQPIFDVPAEKWDSYSKRSKTCPACEGKKETTRYKRTTNEISCPKDDYFIDLLDQHEDSGRFICYSGFTGSIDRCCNTARKNGWAVIRVDARGWHATDYQNNVIPVHDIFDPAKGDPYLQMFQDIERQFPRVCYIAHPKSGGMGVTLTQSHGAFYYSNSFDGEDRMQSEDRGHRPGMDLNLGFTIYDCIHLPTDKLVLDNLQKKKKLQDMTLGVFKEALEEPTMERVV